jgi:hypothetical protein
MPDPLGYFLTWATYGTWLPGDERGWVWHGRGFQLPDPIQKLESEARMTEDACILDPEQRKIVETTIARHCDIRRWQLHVVNCRTNHLHVVVSAPLHPDKIRSEFKAWCTRSLKDLDRERRKTAGDAHPVRDNWWAERGSRRYLDDEQSLEAAIVYVRDVQ